MYTLIDRPVAALNKPARLLLWAMRGWSWAVQQGSCPPLALSRGFSHMRARGLLPDFHIAMALLDRHARDPIALAPMACRQIAEHEAVLLVLWRDLALGRDRAEATLALLVEEDGVSPLSRAMTTTLAKLALAGFDMTHLELQTTEE